MTTPAVDIGAELSRLRSREQELLAEIRRLTAENHELAKAAETSRNFAATRAAGYIELDSLEAS